MSFWIAFIVAQNLGWKRKLRWSLAGILAIWFINCLRIATLLIALNNKWQVNKYKYMEHHDMFNLVAYALIIGMMYLVYKRSKTKHFKPLKDGKENGSTPFLQKEITRSGI